MQMIKAIWAWLLRAIKNEYTPEEVNMKLSKLAAANREHLDWRHSIVDLLKLLQQDSSYSARKDLANELGYTLQYEGSNKDNTWLHAEIMRRLAMGEITIPEAK